ncbi:MAG: hypothetical protein EZS28_030039 [Streblomastix strix]|uniref:Uncharacterized protein n=1 Tax=Streblomastix strix TaxID=222440 RepID=A0A5J4UVU1_9EUKA|nr:MAG: hypothetical protein EZS28_030039 [Streblomastix strix]
MLDKSEERIRVSGLGLKFGRNGIFYSEAEAILAEEKNQESDEVNEERYKDQNEIDCNKLSGAEVFEDLVRGCVFTSECDQQVEDKSVDLGEFERQVLLDEGEQWRYDVVKKEVQRELTLQLSRLGCDDVGDLGSVLYSMGGGGNREVLSQVGEWKAVVNLDRQCGGGVSDQAKASQKGDIGDCQMYLSVIEEPWNRTLYEAYL